MKNIKVMIASLTMCLLAGCINSPIGFRSVIHLHNQNAKGTEHGVGYITSKPISGDSNIAADKTTSGSFNPSTDIPLLQNNDELSIDQIDKLTNIKEEPRIEHPES